MPHHDEQIIRSVNQEFWPYCLSRLEQELPQQQFNTWIKTLRADAAGSDGRAGLSLVAPNRFVLQWVRERYLRRITELGEEFHGAAFAVELKLPAAGKARAAAPLAAATTPAATSPSPGPAR